MSETLDLLLKSDLPDVQKKLPTAQYKVKRLSKELGQNVVFQLRAIPAKRIHELKEMDTDEMNVNLILDGVVSPNLRDTSLMDKYGVLTNADVVRSMFLPGEIENIALAVERLCGYRAAAIEELKND